MATSTVAYAETITTFGRKYQGKELTNQEYGQCVIQFKEDLEHFLLVPADKNLNQYIDKIAFHYPLRGFDAVHLASALILSASPSLKVTFIGFDKQLNRAAKQEGLSLLE